MITPNADRERRLALHLLRREGDAVPAGLFCMVTSLTIVWWQFAERAAPWPFNLWLAYMVFVISALFVAHVVSSVWQPDDDIYLDRFGPIGRWLNFGLTLGAAASVWVFLPVADYGGQMFLIIIYMWFVMVQVMVHGEGLRILTTTTIFGVLGSLILYLLLNPMAYSAAVVIVLALVALTMTALQKVFRSAMREAIEARIVSEETAQARDQALAAVVVERDAKTRFLEAASHDLRQPLQAARMFLDQAEQSPHVWQRAKAIDKLHWALDATDRSLTQVLEFLKLDGSEIKANVMTFTIGPLLAHIAELHQPLGSESGVTISAIRSSVLVQADPDLVTRAIGNFVGNALRHAKCKRILIAARASGKQVRIWVIDDGIGTVPADRASLFDDYVQGSNHGDTQRGGFGLGLASVRRLAGLMGGAAGLDDRWENGSAFWLELPRSDC